MRGRYSFAKQYLKGGFSNLRATLTIMDRGLVSDGAVGGRPAADAPETRSTAPRRHNRRLRGIDAARAIAVLGMVTVHFGPKPAPDAALVGLYGISHGRASVLFVLLAGVGVALLVGDRSRKRPSLARGRLILRGALLLPLGLWLQQLDHGALVILQYYAVYFLFAALVLTLPDRWLLTGAAAALVAGPLIYLGGEVAAPEWFTRYTDPSTLNHAVGKIVRDLLLAGAYSLSIWAAPLLVGLWLGRRDLAAAAVRWWLLVLGLAIALASALAADGLAAAFGEMVWETGESRSTNLLTDRPHSQMPLWMLGSIGSACAVLGGMLLLAVRLPRATWPLVTTGQLALTVYVGHLLLLDAYPELLRRETVLTGTIAVVVFMLLAAAACTLWRAILSRGPLEAALAAPWQIIERLARPVIQQLAARRG